VLLSIGNGNKLQAVGLVLLIAHDCIQHHGSALVYLGQFNLHGLAFAHRTRQHNPQTCLADVFGVTGQNISAFDHADFRMPGTALMPSGWGVVSYGAILCTFS